MLYVIIGREAPDALSKRRATRPDHLAHIRPLIDAGRLVVGGPMPAIDAADPGPAGFSGSLVIAEFESLDAAREFANRDPYLQAGVFTEVDVRPFLQNLP